MNVPGIVLSAEADALLTETLEHPSHAMLLTGPAGSGKTRIARSLGKELLGAPDVTTTAYYREVTAKDASISIEQVRGLITFFRLTVPGRQTIKRVAVIQDADTMGIEAQNALLKMLEEPPLDSVLILTSSSPRRLLATILSRVRQLYLPAPAADQLQVYFKDNGYDEAHIKAALLRSGGTVAEAEKILHADDTADEVMALVRNVLAGSSYERMLTVDALAKKKDAAAAFVDTLATVAAASMNSAAQKRASSLERWRQILQASYTAATALQLSGNTKLVLTELMLAL